MSEATLVVTNAKIVDCVGRVDPRPGSLVVSGDRISRVSSGEETDSRGVPTIDCAGQVVLPGLVDAHVHVTGVDVDYHHQGQRYPDSLLTLKSAARMRTMLRLGYTTVRDAGGADIGLRAAVQQGLISAPNLLISGNPICQTGGHWDIRPRHTFDATPPSSVGPYGVVVDGVDAVRHAAREQLRRGADFLKVFASGGITGVADELDDVQFDVDEITAIVQAATARGRWVMAHAMTPAAIRNCISAGVRSVEHGSFLDESTAKQLADSGIFLVPTLGYLKSALGLHHDNGEDPVAAVLSATESAIRFARDAGVRIGLGSDLVGDTLEHMGRQVSYLADLIGLEAAILSVTEVNAEICDVHRDRGTIEVGKVADLIVVPEEVLDHPDMLADQENIRVVVKAGVVAKSDQLRQSSEPVAGMAVKV